MASSAIFELGVLRLDPIIAGQIPIWRTRLCFLPPNDGQSAMYSEDGDAGVGSILRTLISARGEKFHLSRMASGPLLGCLGIE